MSKSYTERWFEINHLKDRNWTDYHIQDSSVATEVCVWLWIDGNEDRLHIWKDEAVEIIEILKEKVVCDEKKSYSHILTFNTWTESEQLIIDTDNKVLKSEQWNKLVTDNFWKSKSWVLINHTIIENN